MRMLILGAFISLLRIVDLGDYFYLLLKCYVMD